jgi:hypothetical protein
MCLVVMCLVSKFLYLRFIHAEARSLSVFLSCPTATMVYDSDTQIPGAVTLDDHNVYNVF